MVQCLDVQIERRQVTAPDQPQARCGAARQDQGTDRSGQGGEARRHDERRPPPRAFDEYAAKRRAETEGDVRVVYRQGGKRYEATRTNGVAAPAELFEPLPRYLYKSLWFRRHVSLIEPMHCTQ